MLFSSLCPVVLNILLNMKGYKVTNKNRSKLIGVACDSLKQLLIKGKEKLGIKEEVVAALDDGTIIDDEDYFRALPAQTIVILYRTDEDIVTGVDIVLNVLRSVNFSYLETGSKAKEFIMTKTNELMNFLIESEKDGREQKNTPQEDPDWFEGLETNCRTKDEYMFKKSQERIRGYFYKFQNDLRKIKAFIEDLRFRRLALDCLQFLKNRLKEDEYFGCYFDRRCACMKQPKSMKSISKTKREKIQGPVRKKSRKETCQKNGNVCLNYDKLSYCDAAGKFVCQGKWKLRSCEFVGEHQINPYLSREARIMFSTWNLDHRIEKSRSIAPTLVKVIQQCGKSQSVNFLYFYQLLFTKLNLKLVHIICHDKSIHDVSCDPRFFYT